MRFQRPLRYAPNSTALERYAAMWGFTAPSGGGGGSSGSGSGNSSGSGGSGSGGGGERGSLPLSVQLMYLTQKVRWPAWKCVQRAEGLLHPGTPTPSLDAKVRAFGLPGTAAGGCPALTSRHANPPLRSCWATRATATPAATPAQSR